MDFGTGDGTYAYRLAKLYPEKFVIGIDSNAENLTDISHKATLKPAKGGLTNVAFGQLALEQAPGALSGLADSVSVLLPWGSLLKAVALPDLELLEKLKGLCKPNASITILFGYGLEADASQIKELGLAKLTPLFLRSLELQYQLLGFKIKVREASVDEVKALPSKWAKKLAFSGKERTFVKIEGRLPPN